MQFEQPYVHTSTSTTRPRRSASERGALLSHAVAPASSGAAGRASGARMRPGRWLVSGTVTTLVGRPGSSAFSQISPGSRDERPCASDITAKHRAEGARPDARTGELGHRRDHRRHRVEARLCWAVLLTDALWRHGAAP